MSLVDVALWAFGVGVPVAVVVGGFAALALSGRLDGEAEKRGGVVPPVDGDYEGHRPGSGDRKSGARGWEELKTSPLLRVALEPVVMPHPLHTVTINTLADMEACCRRWRELGATDETKVVIENNFTLDVTGTLQEHHSSGQRTITLDQFPA